MISNNSVRLNEQIRASELRVIGQGGEQIGILSREEALELARKKGLDLVEISPQAKPPVAKIVNWGKYQYQKMKEQQLSRKNSRPVDLKQMRFGLKIGDGDFNVKLRKVRSFLDAGHNVRVQVVFRGREMAHKELGYDLVERIISSLGDDVVADKKPLMAGRNLSTTIRSKK